MNQKFLQILFILLIVSCQLSQCYKRRGFLHLKKVFQRLKSKINTWSTTPSGCPGDPGDNELFPAINELIDGKPVNLDMCQDDFTTRVFIQMINQIDLNENPRHTDKLRDYADALSNNRGYKCWQTRNAQFVTKLYYHIAQEILMTSFEVLPREYELAGMNTAFENLRETTNQIMITGLNDVCHQPFANFENRTDTFDYKKQIAKIGEAAIDVFNRYPYFLAEIIRQKFPQNHDAQTMHEDDAFAQILAILSKATKKQDYTDIWRDHVVALSISFEDAKLAFKNHPSLFIIKRYGSIFYNNVLSFLRQLVNFVFEELKQKNEKDYLFLRAVTTADLIAASFAFVPTWISYFNEDMLEHPFTDQQKNLEEREKYSQLIEEHFKAGGVLSDIQEIVELFKRLEHIHDVIRCEDVPISEFQLSLDLIYEKICQHDPQMCLQGLLKSLTVKMDQNNQNDNKNPPKNNNNDSDTESSSTSSSIDSDDELRNPDIPLEVDPRQRPQTDLEGWKHFRDTHVPIPPYYGYPPDFRFKSLIKKITARLRSRKHIAPQQKKFGDLMMGIRQNLMEKLIFLRKEGPISDIAVSRNTEEDYYFLKMGYQTLQFITDDDQITRNIWYCRSCGGSQAVSEFKILDCIKENCQNCLAIDKELNMNNRTNYKTKIGGKYAMYVEKRITNGDYSTIKTDDLDLIQNLLADENDRKYLTNLGQNYNKLSKLIITNIFNY